MKGSARGEKLRSARHCGRGARRGEARPAAFHPCPLAHVRGAGRLGGARGPRRERRLAAILGAGVSWSGPVARAPLPRGGQREGCCRRALGPEQRARSEAWGARSAQR